MARRYISKNILEDQQQFIHLMDEYEIDIFSYCVEYKLVI